MKSTLLPLALAFGATALAALGCAAGHPAAAPVPEVPDIAVTRRTEPLPRLRVEGNRIVDETGAPVVLRGVNLGDLVPLERRGLLDEPYLREAAAWGAAVVRIPIAPADFRSAGEGETLRLLDRAVDWAEKYGMYVIVDWHSIGNPITGTFFPPAEAFRTTPDEMKAFWRAVAHRYRDRPAVAFYELFNEPAALPSERPGDELRWTDWRELMDELVTIVRAEAPRAIPIVSSLEFTFDLRPAVAEPLRSADVVLAAHLYPGHFASRPGTLAQVFDKYVGVAAGGHPIFVTEVGFDPDDRIMPSVYRAGVGFGQDVLAAVDRIGASWTAFTFYRDPYYPMPLFADWGTYRPTASGAFFKQRMIAQPRR